MKYIRCHYNTEDFWAALEGNKAVRMDKAPYLGGKMIDQVYDLREIKLLAPCEPSKIVALGKNYYAHALEMGEGIPDTPVLFLMPPTCVNHHEGGVPYPAITKRLDYEGELAFVISKEAKKIKAQEANDYIFGYTILNDVTCRDIQKSDGQWTRGKCCDGHAPIGPWLVTDIDPSDLGITTRLNGEIKQSSRTSKFMTSIPDMLEFITQCMTLYPGDIVTTGTPEGIGPMTVGDLVEVEIEGIGILRNTIVQEH